MNHEEAEGLSFRVTEDRSFYRGYIWNYIRDDVDGKRYARKDFPGAERNLFEAEAGALLGLTHQNIVECVGLSVGCSCCSLVLEYVNDDLHNIVQKRKFAGETPPFEMLEAMDIISQIATAIMYLHEHAVAHGDLKPKNLLISYSKTGQMIVKVVDFGLIETKKSIRLVSKRTRYLDIFRWKAPELVQELLDSLTEDLDDPFLEYDTDSDSDNSPDSDESSETKRAHQNYFIKGDIYSFGLVCYVILTGDVPFSNSSSLSKVKEMVLNSDMPEILKLPKDCPSELKTLIETCWNKEPCDRPSSFSDICDKLKNVLTDYSSLKPMELVEPNPLASKASDADITEMAHSPIDVLPRKGEALVSKYIEREASISSVLSCTEEREAFQEIHDQIQGDSRSDDVGPSNQFREPCLEPKHKIFLSYDWAQKDFTEQLCEDLKRVEHFPFFDKRPDSLRKGEKFLPLIMEAAKQCLVAVFVLSDEFFTRLKWPMIELTEFVKAQESTNTCLKILPLFLGITMEQFKEKKRQEHWLKRWQHMARKDHEIDVEEWEHALSKIPWGINAMEYKRGEGLLIFRERVVERLVPPDLKWDVSHVQSREPLCKLILQKMEEVEPSYEYGVRVVGLYGTGGVGKTTISKVVYNQMFENFVGKVCHVELGSMNLVELRKTALQELTGANSAILSNSADQLAHLLKKRMCWQKVFLVLDNVWDNQIEEALMYLKVGYHDNSIVLVTSQSLDILIQQLHIHECDCLEMPELEEEGAIELFLHHTGRSQSSLSENDWKIIKRCVKRCHFLKPEKPRSSSGVERTYCYLPLALKVLGCQLGRISRDVSRWEESLEKLEADKFNMFKDRIHHVFSVLRLGYDALCVEEQHMFMDIALLLVPKAGTYSGQNFPQSDVWKWLCVIYGGTKDAIKESVKSLWRKGLVEEVSGVDELKIHDIYRNFAEAEARAGPFEGRRFFIDKGGTDVLHELQKYPSGSFWPSLERLIIHSSKVRSVKNANLHLCSNVEVLQLFHCKELKEVDVTGMDSLRYMEVMGCNKLGQRIEGVETLGNLIGLRWITDDTRRVPVPKFIHELILLTALHVLQLKGFDWSNVGFFPPNLRGCRNLQELTLSDLWDDSDYRTSWLPDSSNLPKSLLKIDFSNSAELIGSSAILSMTSLTNLQDLDLNCCRMLDDLSGLYELVLLQKLNIGKTEISELPDLRKLEQLQSLDVSYCWNLTSLVCITHATTLRHVDASRCENLRKLPDHFVSLESLEMVDLSGDSLICTLPNDYERLARCGILKVEGCWGLVVPLVNELQQEVPERSHANCVNSIGCVSRCEQSMQSWIDVSLAAYDLLKHVFPDKSCHWSYLLDDGERDVFLIRALCEHYDRGGTLRLSSAVAEVTNVAYEVIQWWAVVVTAPCTFGIVTERAMLEPWNKTMLHYTIVRILPEFLIHGNLAMRKDESTWPGTWAKLGIDAVLRKCKEQLQEGKREHGVHPVYSVEGREVVDTLLREIEKLTPDLPIDTIRVDDSSKVSADSTTVAKFLHPNIESEGGPSRDALGVKGLKHCSILTLNYDKGPRYSDILPNFPFGPILATQGFSWYQSSTKDQLHPWSTHTRTQVKTRESW